MPAKRHRKSNSLSPLALVGVVALLIVALYGIVRIGARDEVLGSVTVLDVQLGGAKAEVALDSLVDLEERLANLPAPIVIAGTTVQILPIQTGFDLDEAAIVAEAMAVGRSDNPVSDLFHWLTHIFSETELSPQGSLDAEALDAVLDSFDESIVGEPPFEGAVSIQDGELTAQYPRPGRRIDRQAARDLLGPQFITLSRAEVTLPIREEQPALSEADVDAALDRASLMLSAPVTLATDDGTSLTFDSAQLAAAFVATTHDDPARIELGFDPAIVETRLAEVRAELEAAPVDARLEISGYEVGVVPGRNGTRLDSEETAAVLAVASQTSLRRADLPLQEGAEPDVTTESLEALDIRHLVAQFTTHYDCCAPRVDNIHLIADEVDGAIVAPGATFSLNDYVGQRTADDGYVDAGTIVAGEIVDTVGGGVSQFATTFYNAVFWGGYEDIDHKPHSFYFSRYPEGIEATISWPQPNLVFRNNDDSGVLIKTAYTDSSITVLFYGNNEGRILAGAQNGGTMSVGVVAEGGAGAKQVRGDRSERFDLREPPEPLYRANPELEVDEQDTVQTPGEGWSLTVTRTITVDGDTTTQEWPVRYLARQEIIEVHPCKVPDGDVPCPTTTTTTTTSTTTTITTTTTTMPTTTTPGTDPPATTTTTTTTVPPTTTVPTTTTTVP